MVKDGWDRSIFCQVSAILLPDGLFFKIPKTVSCCWAVLWMVHVGIFWELLALRTLLKMGRKENPLCSCFNTMESSFKKMQGKDAEAAFKQMKGQSRRIRCYAFPRFQQKVASRGSQCNRIQGRESGRSQSGIEPHGAASAQSLAP